MDIEEFYEEDERRRASEEVEFGTEWRDASGSRYELSWVADTGELYVMLEPAVALTEDPFGDVFGTRVKAGELTVAVVGWVPDRKRLEEILEGWQEAMSEPESINWVSERLRANGVPQRAPGVPR